MSEANAPQGPAQGPAQGIVPCLVLRDPAAAADFYAAAFGAVLRDRSPDGRSLALSLAGSLVRLLAADRAAGLLGAESFGGAPVLFTLAVSDLDAAVARAVSHGAVVLAPSGDAADGARTATLRDPFLHVWQLVVREG
jgi:PhnB protein